MTSRRAAVGGVVALALGTVVGWTAAPADARPAAEVCGPPCAWVQVLGTGEGSLLPGGPDTDHRMAALAIPQPDGGAMLVGQAFVAEDRGVWLSGLAPTGSPTSERIEPGNLCHAASDGAGGVVALIDDRETRTHRVSAFGGAGQARWSLDLGSDDALAVAALPDSGAVVLVDDGFDLEILRIDGGQGLLFDGSAQISGQATVALGRDAGIFPKAATALDDGTVIVAGFVGREAPAGVVVALDQENTILWRTDIEEVGPPRDVPCSAHGGATSVVALSDGGIAVLFQTTTELLVPRSLLALLDHQGTVRWIRDPADHDGEPETESLATAMAPTADGGVLLAGTIYRPARRSGNWVERLAGDGTVVWREEVTQPEQDVEDANVDLFLASVTEMPDGGTLAVGTSDLNFMRMRAWAIRLAGEDGEHRDDGGEVPAPDLDPETLLQGVWSGIAGGGDPVVVTFMADGTMILIDRGRPERRRYTVDFGVTPATIDVEVDGDILLGLLEFIDDDTFRAAMGEDVRPTSFDGDARRLAIFTRMSPRPTAPQGTTADEATAPPDVDGDGAEGRYAGSRQAVMDLLALVPDTPMGRDGAPLISYVDIEATIEAAYADAMPGLRFANLSFDDMFPGIMRIRSGPQNYLQHLPVIEDEISGLLGIDVQDVRRGLEFGQPPEWGTILGLDPAGDHTPAITAALNARDFEQHQIGDVTVWHRLDDLEMDIVNRNPGDPFGGHLGQSARIAVLPPALVGGPVWPVAEGMVSAAGDARSLADDPVIAAAVEAVTPPATEGALLQFQLFNVDDAAFAAMPAIDLIPDGQVIDPGTELPAGPAGTLPPYLMVAIADVFAGDRDEAIVALVYFDRGAAEAAAEVLADRFNAFRPASAPDAWANRLEAVGGTIAADVVEAGGGRFAVALTRISSPAVFPTDEQDGLLPAHGGMMFRFLIDALLRRDLTPLAILQ